MYTPGAKAPSLFCSLRDPSLKARGTQKQRAGGTQVLAVESEGDFVGGGGGFAEGDPGVGVGGGGGDREAELADEGAADGGFGDAQGDVAGVGGNAQRELAAGFDDDGERAGPEALGEAGEGAVEGAGELVGLGDVGDEEREGLVAGAGFEIVDAVDGAEIYGVDGE